ncbi:MAG: M48 family metallopeptidase [Alphaproteobacteria bacterium]
MSKFNKKIHSATNLKIKNLNILVIRKSIKKIYLRVATTNGDIHVTVPKKTTDKYLINLITSKIEWLKKYHEFYSAKSSLKILFQEDQELSFLGNKYYLKIINNQQLPRIYTDYQQKIFINKANNFKEENFIKILNQFYRIELNKILVPMVIKWQKIMNLKTNFIGVKKMKTKWGSCNFSKARLWFNSELAKKPLQAIEYVVVHELSHLIEPSHNKRFVAIMNRFLPNWQEGKNKLG